jgi:hypothetical protein
MSARALVSSTSLHTRRGEISKPSCEPSRHSEMIGQVDSRRLERRKRTIRTLFSFGFLISLTQRCSLLPVDDTCSSVSCSCRSLAFESICSYTDPLPHMPHLRDMSYLQAFSFLSLSLRLSPLSLSLFLWASLWLTLISQICI